MSPFESIPEILAWLATYLVHSTVLLGLAWLLTRPARGASPQFTERAWRVGVVGPLVTATVANLFPHAPVLGVIALDAPQQAVAERFEPTPLGTSDSAARTELESGRSERLAPDEPLERPQRAPKRGTPVTDREPLVDREPLPVEAQAKGLAPAGRSDQEQHDGTRNELAAQFERQLEQQDAPPPALKSRTELASNDEEQTGGRRTEREPEPARASAPHQGSKSDREAQDVATLLALGATLTDESGNGFTIGSTPESSLPQSTAALGEGTSDERSASRVSSPPLAGRIGEGGANAARLGALVDRMPRLSWGELTLVLWTTPALVLAVALLLSAVRLGWDLRRRTEVRDAALLARFDAVRRSAGITRPVRLTTSTRLQGPITFGVLRPEVALPVRALGGLRPSHERSMFAHELAHVVRRDPAWFAALAFLERVLFFQPLLRIARKRLVEVAEERADDMAVAWTGDRIGLASCLAEIARWILDGRRRAPALPIAGMASSRLGHRIERLLVPDPPADPKQRWFAPAAVALLVTTAGAAPRVHASTITAGTESADATAAGAPALRADDAPESKTAADHRFSATASSPDALPRVGVDPAFPDVAPERLALEPEWRWTTKSPAAAEPPVLGTAQPHWRSIVLGEYELLESELELLDQELEMLRAELSEDASCSTNKSLDALTARLQDLNSMRDVARQLLHGSDFGNTFFASTPRATETALEPTQR